MRHTIISFVGGLAMAGALCVPAAAQERPYFAEPIAAPSDALELKVGTGYTQGFGGLAPGRNLADVGGAGIGASADVDYRLTHRWSIGLEGQYQELSSEQNSAARGVAVNVGATYHLDPLFRGDPWVRLGSGYRGLWEDNPTGQPVGVTVSRHGFDVLALKLGYDVRVSENVAIAPVVGADLDVFLWQDASDSGAQALANPEVAAFVYAGLQGRFDVGGTPQQPLEPATTTVTAAPMPAPECPPPPPAPVAETRPVAPSLAVSEDIMQKCGLTLESVNDTPKFDFDRTELLPNDLSVLKQIGDCFLTGPMKGAGIILVGRADPRGSVAYNEKLGLKRALHVSVYLEQQGISPSQIERLSRGKLDARGRDASTWAVDRRVDVLAAPH